jgi:hypothetical protein
MSASGRSRLAGALALAGLAGVLLAEAAWFRATASATYDETIYLETAREIERRGNLRPLVDLGVAPLPILAAWSTGPALGPDLDYPQRIAAARRRTAWLVGVPLLVAAFLCVAPRHGWFAGTVAAGLLALSPNILAHASLATTDAAFALSVLVALAAIVWYVRGPSVGRAVGAGAAIGIAIATKYSGLFLLVVAALAMWRFRRGGPERDAPARSSLRGHLTLFASALLVLWAAHGFLMADLIPVKGLSPVYFERFGVPPGLVPIATRLVSIPLPAPVRGIAYQVNHDRASLGLFLLGDVSATGWWYYFPVALALKSTPIELAALLLFAWAAIRSRRDQVVLGVLGGGAAILLALSMTSRLNIGVRLVLPLVPMAIVGTVTVVAERLHGRPRAAIATGLAALALQAFSMAAIAPQYLSYFNVFAGGPSDGYRHLADSNLDWGQDLPRLRDWLAATGTSQVALAYFGTAPPDAYGIDAVSWRDATAGSVAAPRWLAVSATYFVGVYACGDPFRTLRTLTPDARIGYSIFVYGLAREDVRAALEVARRVDCPPGG